MNRKILSLLLVATLAITGIFADISYSNLSTDDFTIELETDVDQIEYTFKLVKENPEATYTTLLESNDNFNDYIKDQGIDILNADSVSAFGIVSSIGNQATDFTVTIKIAPEAFIGTGNNPATGPLPVVSTLGMSDSASFASKTLTAPATYVSEVFTAGLQQKQLLAAFSLGWTEGTPNIKPDTYTSTTTISITTS